MNLTMEAKICFTVLCALFLQIYVKYAESEDEDPCTNFPCAGISLCWYDDSNLPKCENACDRVTCDVGFSCHNEVGECGNANCQPVAKCHSNPCTGIKCPYDQQCSVVVPVNGGRTAICGKNPCVGYECCVRSDGNLCEKNGCYLEKTDQTCGPGQVCEVVPVCRDPCVVTRGVCKKPGEFCYTNKAVCVAPPCDPVPVCRSPCNTDITNVCDEGQNCTVVWVNCVADKDSPFYDPYCKPKEICQSP